MKYNILVVEDEKNILDVIKAYLEKEGFNVFVAEDGEIAIELFNAKNIHLIVLDLMIPKISGNEVCRSIRKESNIPIIMLTAKSDEESKITNLSLGADDYMVKPFSPKELVSRVHALLRRSYKIGVMNPQTNLIIIDNGKIKVDLDKMKVTKNGINIDFTSNEFKVLSVLVQNKGIVLSRDNLIEKAFGYEYEGFDRTIDTHVKNIRQKLEDNPKSPSYILTVYGVGYKFEEQKNI